MHVHFYAKKNEVFRKFKRLKANKKNSLYEEIRKYFQIKRCVSVSTYAMAHNFHNENVTEHLFKTVLNAYKSNIRSHFLWGMP